MRSTALLPLLTLLLAVTGCSTKPPKVYGELRPCMVENPACTPSNCEPENGTHTAAQSDPDPTKTTPVSTSEHETNTTMLDPGMQTAQSDSNATATPPSFSSRFLYLAQNSLEDVSRPIIEEALEKGESINSLDSDGRSLMYYAKSENNTELLRYLLDQGFSLDNEPSLLAYSYEHDDIDLAKELIDIPYRDKEMVALLDKALQDKKDAWIELFRNLGIRSPSDKMIFRKAVDANDPMMAENYLQEGFRFEDDPKLLSYAIEKNRIDFMKYLVSRGYDLNSDPMLLPSILEKRDFTLADYLIERGMRKTFPKTLISQMHQNYDVELLEFFTFHGLQATFTTSELLDALKENKQTFARMMLKHTIKDDTQGYNAVTLAARTQNMALLKLLIDYGYDINKKDSFGRTALMYLANDPVRTRWLVAHGADVNAVDPQGRSVLMYASHYIPVAKILIEHGADLLIRDQNHNTILNYAVNQNNVQLAKLILPHNLPVNAVDNRGNRILNYSQSLDMTRVLMKHKARY